MTRQDHLVFHETVKEAHHHPVVMVVAISSTPLLTIVMNLVEDLPQNTGTSMIACPLLVDLVDLLLCAIEGVFLLLLAIVKAGCPPADGNAIEEIYCLRILECPAGVLLLEIDAIEIIIPLVTIDFIGIVTTAIDLGVVVAMEAIDLVATAAEAEAEVGAFLAEVPPQASHRMRTTVGEAVTIIRMLLDLARLPDLAPGHILDPDLHHHDLQLGKRPPTKLDRTN